MGISTSTCGAHGALCTECGLGLSCSTTGACVFSSGGGVSGTGGGTVSGGGNSGGGVATGGGFVTGGGVGRIDQELVSGTRLRALNYVGADGSRAPLGFWDNQLDTVCQAALAYFGGPPRCQPVITYPQTQSAFADSACTIPIFSYQTTSTVLGVGPYLAAGLPMPRFYGASSVVGDGGVSLTFHTLAPATAWFNKSGTTCTAAPIPAPAYVSTGVVPISTFAELSVVRE